jgi:hypothetical protein
MANIEHFFCVHCPNCGKRKERKTPGNLKSCIRKGKGCIIDYFTVKRIQYT